MIAALAMGLQASAITHFGSAAVNTVVVTGTIARIADAVTVSSFEYGCMAINYIGKFKALAIESGAYAT